jgi:HxlR-like helix-turn-helix
VPAADGSLYQEYALTTKGRSLFPVVVAMRQWGENHLFRTGEKHSVLLELATGAPLAPLQPSNAKGQVVVSEETVVQKVAAR